MATSWLPLDLVEGTPIVEANPGPGGIYARLEDMGHHLERFTEDVSAHMPQPCSPPGVNAKVTSERLGITPRPFPSTSTPTSFRHAAAGGGANLDLGLRPVRRPRRSAQRPCQQRFVSISSAWEEPR